MTLRSLRFARIPCDRHFYLIGKAFPAHSVRICARLQNNRNGEVTFRIQLHRVRGKRCSTLSPVSPIVTTGNSIYQRNILNGHAIICLDIARHIYRVSQTEGFFHRIKSNLKGRPLVILHPYGNGRSVFDFNRKVTIQANCRQHQFCRKGTEFVGIDVLLYQFFSVYVQQTYLITLSCQNLGLIRFLFISDAFDINSLTGTIQRTVRQQSDMFFRTRLTALVISVQINNLRHHSGICTFTRHIAADSFIPFYNSLAAGIGSNRLHQFAVFFIVRGIETDRCIGNRLSATAIYRNHLHFVIRQRQRQYLETG